MILAGGLHGGTNLKLRLGHAESAAHQKLEAYAICELGLGETSEERRAIVKQTVACMDKVGEGAKPRFVVAETPFREISSIFLPRV